MAYDEQLAERVRIYLKPVDEITEKKMFGGLCFLYKGKMSVGIIKGQLVGRVISEKFEKALNEKHTSDMDFTGRKMKNFVYVSQEGLETEEELSKWIELGIEHAKNALK